jgi:AcrR family transcriptional regulator
MTESSTSVDPRVKRTRKLLQQAFIELFQEKALASISVQDITERATVNRATFYAHFPDKYALLDSIIREQFQQVLAQYLPLVPVWSVQSLRALVKATFTCLDGFYQHCKLTEPQSGPLIEQAIQQELEEVLLRWFKRAKVAGKRPGLRLELVASVVSWAIFGPAVHWGRYEVTPSADEMTNQTLLVITEGLAHLAPGFLPVERV